MPRASCLFGAVLALSACSGATSTGSELSGGNGGAGGNINTGTGGAGGTINTGSGGSSGTGNVSGCSIESQFVYTLDQQRTLWRFDPPSLQFTQIGTVNCPGVINPFSMAVDRVGNAWIVFAAGGVFRVDTKTAACTATGYVAGQGGYTTFGMGFSTDGPGSTHDTLFVSDSAVARLGKIDTQSLSLANIGGYDSITGRAELTGTGDGRLYGAFEGSPYVVAEIDKTTAHILSKAPQNAVNYPPGSSNFAFAFWGGDFWLFVGPGSKTDVFHYETASGQTTLATSVSQVIVGAGVSTCAPTVPPS